MTHLTSLPGINRIRIPSGNAGEDNGVSLLLSIDPGLSTGVAIFYDGELSHSYTTQAPHDRLRRELAFLESPDKIVCEKGPTNRRQAAACEPVEAIVQESETSVSWVRPTAWKPSPKACLKSTDDPSNKHEKDAIRMGRWHLARTAA